MAAPPAPPELGLHKALAGAPEPDRDAAPAPGAPKVPHPKTIKSFVKRGGRTTTAQALALATLGPRWLLPFARQPLDARAVFGRSAPLVLEIGFGMGEATAHIAALRPQHDFLCCEVHEPGVGALLKRIDALGLSNVRIVRHDAVEVLEHMLAPATLAGVHVFFPDPWHKLRHHKRRLIQPPLVARLAQRLQPGGYLHCATDWQPYAEQMLQVLGAEPLLVNTAAGAGGAGGAGGANAAVVAGDAVTANATAKSGSGSGLGQGGYAPKPDYRPLTKFEQRGLRLGHGVWDLVFVRR
ncbi:MAG: tRNA (guanosine(46)-N7)-methyltransferase TrmB [Betaproteobacteria bacterium]|nr:tRNA (guanosine(46)-N7)-methyltransferase TrmB [Betaproteobacteria bacterium]